MRQRLGVLLVMLAAVSWGACTGIVYDPSNSNNANLPPGVDAGVTSDGAVGTDTGTGPGPCDGVSCGAVGSCVDVGGAPACDCPSGYHAEGLACVQDEPPDPCDAVTCGAHATCTSGVCECDSGYEGDPVAGCDPEATEEELARAELVTIAMGELGKCEGVDDEPYMLNQPGYWCYDFVAWVYQQSSWSLPSPISLPAYDVGNFPAGWQPEPGDLIKFTIQHYGMVKEVASDGQSLTTVEGNFNSCVVSRTVYLGDIQYFGTLDSVFP